MSFPAPVSGRVSEETKAQIAEAHARFGPSESTIVRMALEAFLPGYLAAQGRPENVEFFAKLAAALDARPEIKAEIEKAIRAALRWRKEKAVV